jgi:hemerythrin HHE cation binding domain-containing protein
VLHERLAEDHARLDRLLKECLDAATEIPYAAYEELRRGLLRHIAIEERVLFPELRKVEGSAALERQLHRDHAALSALLVPPPTHTEIEQIAAILEMHNVLEERDGGMYELVESAAGADLPALLERVDAIPPVRLAPHSDTPLLRKTIEQLLREAEEGRRRLHSSSVV